MRKYISILVFISLLIPVISLCQYQEIQINTFSSRLSNPLKIEVSENDRGTLDFTVKNDSWFTYHVELKFSVLENLSPATESSKDVVLPGKKTLFRLKVIDAKSLHNYSYNFSYGIGDPNKNADEDFQYLIPLSGGKTIKLLELKNNTNAVFFRNVFYLNNGDTILCMRKGTVTSTSNNTFNQNDRIDKNSTVEILHTDGTIATYNFPEDKKVLVVPGQQVYPLQPIVVSQHSGEVSISLFKLQKNNMLKSFDFKYEGDSTNDAFSNGSIVKHLSSNIEKELTKKEKKRLANGTLYEK
ncbi:MAG: hypothetical protein ABI148_05805 [Ginsengibacter sp.]